MVCFSPAAYKTWLATANLLKYAQLGLLICLSLEEVSDIWNSSTYIIHRRICSETVNAISMKETSKRYSIHPQETKSARAQRREVKTTSRANSVSYPAKA